MKKSPGKGHPVDASEEEMSSAFIDALERDGIVRRGTGVIPEEIWRQPPGCVAGVLAALLEERESGSN